jgi:aryl-alcohol dehydrogenase-like predicted oxidoreductase
MRYVEAAGVRLSRIGIGTWQFGSAEWGYGSEYSDRTASQIIERGVELGVNLIDTAELYGFGKSERILAPVLEEHRDSAFIATKVTPVVPFAPWVRSRGRASAKRLGVDRIDLYQVHAPNPTLPIGHIMGGMVDLVSDGVVTHLGVSNYNLAQWKLSEQAAGIPVISNQVRLNLVDRGPLTALVPYARAYDRIVIAYSPLAQGLLSGNYNSARLPKDRMRRANPLFLPDNLEAAKPLLDTLARVAQRYGATSAQIALAWVISHDHVVAIPGASSIAQLEHNVAAADLVLSADDLAELSTSAVEFTPNTGLGTLPRRALSALR